tara:strand:+ start:329 stop:526 length:198 start_codon:yes stop_codon:yes gene_type:complete
MLLMGGSLKGDASPISGFFIVNLISAEALNFATDHGLKIQIFFTKILMVLTMIIYLRNNRISSSI